MRKSGVVAVSAVMVVMVACGKGVQEAVAPVSDGMGVPQATVYDPRIPGPHRLVLLSQSGGSYSSWNDHLPPDWVPESVDEVALVVVVSQIEERLDSQAYSDGLPITRYRHDLHVQVRAARTGDLVEKFTLEGPDPGPFPQIASRSHTRIDGNEVEFVQLEEVLRRFVTPLNQPPIPKMTFAWIEPGSFVMGSPKLEADREDDEQQHQVTLTKGYWMQTTEVTQEQWKAVMLNNPSRSKEDKRPVERVSWNDAQDFIRMLNERDSGKNYRLPTEAEWEYACRAGTTGSFYYGERLISTMASFTVNDPNRGAKEEPFREETTLVGSFQPNQWGLYDMHGNVSEWCEDWYAIYPTGTVTDPTGPSSGSLRIDSTVTSIDPTVPFDRVVRGGSWRVNAQFCRSASRLGLAPDSRHEYVGFRLVKSVR